jgi:ribosome maturation factor RimP
VGFAPTFYFALETMDKQLIIEHVKEIASKVTAASGIELVHVDISGTKRDLVLRIFIDKEMGVTLDDCSGVSRSIEEVLDTEDFIPSRYVLEVSSPGIERQLYSLNDFVKFKGHLAKVRLKSEIDGQKAFVGQIVDVDGLKITVEDRTKGSVSFSYPEVDRANLKIDLAKEFGGR